MTTSVVEKLRWKTLSAAVGPAIVGTGLALAKNGELSIVPFLCCGPSAFLIQIGTNLTNDALDFRNGIEEWKSKKLSRLGENPNRTAPIFYLYGILCFPLALLFSLPTILLRGSKLLILEILCCFVGYLYTGGPYPLAYYCLGDLAVLAFFGVVATSGARFVHQGGVLFASDSVIAGLQVGFFAVNMLVVNNLRDIHSDALAGKRTISNLLGYNLGRWQLVLNCLCGYLLGLWWLHHYSSTAFFLPLFTTPLAVNSIRRVFRTKPSIQYNRFLQQFSILHLVFCFALSLGLMLS